MFMHSFCCLYVLNNYGRSVLRITWRWMGDSSGSMMQACYAMGYNLAIEYLADYEKTWMLDSFRALNERVLVPQQRGLSQWLFLEV